MEKSNYVEGMCFSNRDKYNLGQKQLLSLTGTWLLGKTAFQVSYCDIYARIALYIRERSLGSSLVHYLLSSVRFLY